MSVRLVALALVFPIVAGCLAGFQGGSGHACADAAAVPEAAVEPGAPDSVTVLVTRDHGLTLLSNASVDAVDGMTVMDALMEVADVETGYGGGFVVAIDGLRSQYPDSPLDWFFEVDGAVSGIGAAQWTVTGGERVHWDYRPWSQPLTPGLFNTFPWETARVLVADGDDAQVPMSLAARAEAWTGTWPSGPAVLVTSPDGAPWDLLPGEATDASVTVCDQRLEAPWSLAARVAPGEEARAVLVGAGSEPPVPTAGTAWLTTPEAAFEVHPA